MANATPTIFTCGLADNLARTKWPWVRGLGKVLFYSLVSQDLTQRIILAHSRICLEKIDISR